MGNKDKKKKHLVNELAAAKRRIAKLKKSKAKLRQTKVALAESGELYRSLVETSPDAITLTDLNANVIMTNKRTAELYGFKNPGKMVGKNAFKFIAPQDRQRAKKNLKKTLKYGTVKNIKYTLLKKNGTSFLGELSASVIVDAEGKPKYFIGVVRNITRRDKVEERLRILATAVEQSIDGIAVVGLDENIKFVNLKWAEMHGYKPSELIGKHLSIFHTKEQMKKDVIPFNKQVKKIGAYDGEMGHVKKDGTTFQTWMSVSLLRDEKRDPIGLVGIVRDITERKKAEEELQIRVQILLNMAEGVNVSDSKKKIFFANPRFDAMFGYKRGELFGKDVTVLNNLTPKENAQLVKKTMKHLKQKRHWSGEFVNRKKNGTIFSTRAHISTLKMHGKTYYISVQEDITERKKMEKNLKKLNKELLQSNKKLQQLALKDPQTGLYNHHYLPEALEAEFYRARRYVHPFSLMMLDIDYFKSINDVYGHKFGDLVLKQVAKQLMNLVRRYDIIIRFGGEEFAIILPGTDRSAALTLGRRLLDSISLYNFGDKRHTVKLTFSMAVVSYPEDRIVKHMDLVDLADRVLNKVKEEGGDRVYSTIDIKKEKEKKAPLAGKEESTEVKFLREKLKKLTKKSKQSLIESIFAFAKTIELKDHYTGEHVEKTVYYAAEIARELGLSEEEIMHIRQAAVLHDLGKVGISEKILLKKSKLKKKEFKEIMKHPQIGTDIIRPIKFLHDIIPFILYHHENWDGKGYPTGLKGEDIPIGARIISLSDVYQALISDRPYRKAYPKPKAIKIIKELSGTKFDPKVVKAFLKILKRRTK